MCAKRQQQHAARVVGERKHRRLSVALPQKSGECAQQRLRPITPAPSTLWCKDVLATLAATGDVETKRLVIRKNLFRSIMDDEPALLPYAQRCGIDLCMPMTVSATDVRSATATSAACVLSPASSTLTSAIMTNAVKCLQCMTELGGILPAAGEHQSRRWLSLVRLAVTRDAVGSLAWMADAGVDLASMCTTQQRTLENTLPAIAVMHDATHALQWLLRTVDVNLAQLFGMGRSGKRMSRTLAHVWAQHSSNAMVLRLLHTHGVGGIVSSGDTGAMCEAVHYNNVDAMVAIRTMHITHGRLVAQPCLAKAFAQSDVVAQATDQTKALSCAKLLQEWGGLGIFNATTTFRHAARCNNTTAMAVVFEMFEDLIQQGEVAQRHPTTGIALVCHSFEAVQWLHRHKILGMHMFPPPTIEPLLRSIAHPNVVTILQVAACCPLHHEDDEGAAARQHEFVQWLVGVVNKAFPERTMSRTRAEYLRTSNGHAGDALSLAIMHDHPSLACAIMASLWTPYMHRQLRSVVLKDGRTLLHQAARFGNVGLLRAMRHRLAIAPFMNLFYKAAAPELGTDCCMPTPLAEAIEHGRLGAVRFFVAQHQLKVTHIVNGFRMRRSTATAIQHGQVKLLPVLQQAGINLMEHDIHSGLLPLHVAILEKQAACVEMLRRLCADTLQPENLLLFAVAELPSKKVDVKLSLCVAYATLSLPGAEAEAKRVCDALLKMPTALEPSRCAVCMNDNVRLVGVVLPCRHHEFCQGCLHAWVSNTHPRTTCPLCKGDVHGVLTAPHGWRLSDGMGAISIMSVEDIYTAAKQAQEAAAVDDQHQDVADDVDLRAYEVLFA